MEEKDLNKEETTAEEKAEEVKADPVEEANKRAYDAEKKCAETNDKYLRTLAEYDNFRKRTAKEREGIYAANSLSVLWRTCVLRCRRGGCRALHKLKLSGAALKKHRAFCLKGSNEYRRTRSANRRASP